MPDSITPNPIPDSNPVRDDYYAADTIRFRQAILASKAMLTAYAVSLVVLSVGSVFLVIILTILCFMQPEKANAFLLLLGGPVFGLLIAHADALKKLLMIGKLNGNSHNLK